MKRFYLVVAFVFTIIINYCAAQELRFNHILGDGSSSDEFLSLAQDKYGFMWFTRQLGGLQRYDGYELKSYLHDPDNTNSLAANWVECLVIDKANIFWLGTYGKGLDRFDPATNNFTHFVHNDKDPASLSNNTVTALYLDRSDNLWVGTLGGLDLLDKKTGKFIHYKNDPSDPESLSDNEVRVIYEDRAGKIWAGCGRPFINLLQKPEDGGLNCLDLSTGKFKRYKHDAANPNSIASNKVRAIFEDSKGNFWIGTRDDGLQTLDRKTGNFTHYYYDPTNPEKLSRPSQFFADGVPEDHIAFITEDPAGNIIIGTHIQGINYYNTSTKTITHYGYLYDKNGNIAAADTATGLNVDGLWNVFKSRDGLIWVEALHSVFTINPYQPYLPYYSVNEKKPDVNSLYCETNGNILWIGTDQGLFRKDLRTNEQVMWKHDPSNANSLANDTVVSIKGDSDGKLWVGTFNGLCHFDPAANMFTNWYHDDKKVTSLSSNSINYLFIDKERNLWIGTNTTGLDKLNVQTGIFSNYRHDDKNRNSIDNDLISGICEDQNGNMWIATGHGLNSLNSKTGKIGHYFPNSFVSSVYMDASGVVWTAVPNSIYYFDNKHNIFRPFENINRREEISNIINIVEDRNKNLWLSTSNSIIRINDKRDAVKIYDSSNAVHFNNFSFADNCVSKNGEIFLGDQSGYYAFFPEDVKDKSPAPVINFTSFKIADDEVRPGKDHALDTSVLDDQEIKLNYRENNFSFEFAVVSFTSTGNDKFLYKLENYDNKWRYIGNERKAYFFNIEPGKYILHVRGVRKDGVWGEKAITIIISPPWWRTWWAYALFTVLFVAAIWGFIAYRSRNLRRANKLLEEKVTIRTHELKEEKEKVESTLSELKSTQSQLIQKEKMASLGELSAGIAHEIQNPLNFVNNFSEVNKEMLEELKAERLKPKAERDEQTEDEILNDVIANEEKINHHGKRADAIVKGMLQHSQTSTGQKEPTDINKLADEYLRLSYQGFRAKDKSFNAILQTDLDESIGKINIIPQDIGRVLLNLYNNAFYAVSEKNKQQGQNYEPTVSVKTKKNGDKVLISVSDNGNGISQKILDKIFQPFFTTKPTGQGTGLGLSLAYDIIKAHGGEIRVETKGGEGAEFIIYLPII